jgi:hypothetical protein
MTLHIITTRATRSLIIIYYLILPGRNTEATSGGDLNTGLFLSQESTPHRSVLHA